MISFRFRSKPTQPLTAAGLLLVAFFLYGQAPGERPPAPPGSRSVVDAHNCYPYNGKWGDRIDRALKTGVPVAIEQDLLWYTDPRTGVARSLLSHGAPADGTEPGMREYFFEKIRPIMEEALDRGNQGDWPLITLNLDFKSDEAEHHAAVWKLLSQYAGWLCTAQRSADPGEVTPMHAGPLLVLTGEADSQQRDFYDILPVGAKLLVFGAVHRIGHDADVPPRNMIATPATNYRRWWNNPWNVVERGGQRNARDWTERDRKRLAALVGFAHKSGLWIRFYTLNGCTPAEDAENGWEPEYNFGTPDRVMERWMAELEARVDYIATDEYEELAKAKARFLFKPSLLSRPGPE